MNIHTIEYIILDTVRIKPIQTRKLKKCHSCSIRWINVTGTIGWRWIDYKLYSTYAVFYAICCCYRIDRLEFPILQCWISQK